MKNFASLGIGLATVSLALGYALSAHWIWVAVIVALGLFWLAGQWRGWSLATTLGIIFFIGVTVWGVWQGVSPGWMLFSLVATLVAWDLDQITRRWQQAGRTEGEVEFKRVHLQRLLIIASLGLLLGGVALSLQFELNLGWAVFWGLVAIAGLNRVIGFLRRESD